MTKRLPIVFAALLLIGVLACPKPRGANEVDPVRCFEHAFRAEAGAGSATSRRMRVLIERNYTFSVAGEDTIAGRGAWVLAIRPRIKKRPWRQLWIDQKTSEILAMRDWSSRNRLRRSACGLRGFSTAFHEARPYSKRPKAVLKPRSPSKPEKVRSPRYVPPGFELVEVRTSATGGWSQIVYSDGLCAISVFQRFPARLSREHKNAIGVYGWGGGLLVSTFCAGRRIVVVGDLRRDELERMAGSIP